MGLKNINNMKTNFYSKSHSLKAPLWGVGGLIIALLMLGVFTSCLKDYEGPPLTEPIYTGPDANITIAELRTHFSNVTESTPIRSNFILRARVAANDISGNLFSQLYVQDETGGIIINIARSSLFNDFRVGQEVFIHLREFFITTFGGQIQIGFAGVPVNRIPWEIFNEFTFRNGWPQADKVTPRLVTIDALDDSMMATLVQLDNVFFQGGGELPFTEQGSTTNRFLTDFDGNSIIVRTSSFANFSSYILPEGAGTIVGMLTRHNADWQIILRTIDDVIDFGDEIPTPPETTVIFNETFGNPVQVGTLWPTIAEFAQLGGFVTTGIGAGDVSFATDPAGGRVDVRGNQVSNFPGASGGGNTMFSAANGGTLFINDIATCGAQNLVLSFGTNVTSEQLSVAYRINGTDEWIPIPFHKGTDTWGIVNNLSISLPAETNTIRLRFIATSTQFGARIDDVKITTEDETGEPIIDPDTPPLPPPPPYTLLFNETFGIPVQYGTPLQWPTIAGYTGFVTTGIGAGAVVFASEGGRVDVRANQVSNFPEASGGGNVMFSADNGGTLFINQIATCGAQNLVLSFGTNQTDAIISVAYRISGTNNWVDIPFTKETTTWGLVENLNITLPAGTNTINLRFTAGTTEYGARIDDVRITTTDETGEPVIDLDNGGTPPPPPPVYTLLFNETFGNPSSNTTIANFTGWVTTGIGASSVTFSSAGGTVDVRVSAPSIPVTGDNAGVPWYTGASGQGNVMFNLLNGGTLYINNIGVFGTQNLLLSFGTNHNSTVLSVAYSVDGTNWSSIPFDRTVTPSNTSWGLVEALPVNLPAGTTTVSLRFVAASQASGSSNARIDDVRVITYDTPI